MTTKRNFSTTKVKNYQNLEYLNQQVRLLGPILLLHNLISRRTTIQGRMKENSPLDYGHIGIWEFIVKWKMFSMIKIGFILVQHLESDHVIKLLFKIGLGGRLSTLKDDLSYLSINWTNGIENEPPALSLQPKMALKHQMIHQFIRVSKRIDHLGFRINLQGTLPVEKT